ncbi:toxic anion resistance protein [Brevundimonas sp.]
MTVVGSITPTGGAPKPDPARVAAIRYTIVDEAETCATFGENARANLASLNDRTLAETRSGDLGECVLLLDHVRDRLAVLDPARLAPRSGIAGLFDSRSKRLKTFRSAYVSAASAISQSAADIGDRAGALARKGTALETLWVDTRDAITELDAHIAAARGWLANEASAVVEQEPVAFSEDRAPSVENHDADPTGNASETCEAPADAEAEPGGLETEAPVEPSLVEAADGDVAETGSTQATAEPESATIVALPHPLATRLAVLEAVRATAISRLPLLRAAQNADWRTPAALKQICDGVEAWRADWQDALGLVGKRPKKVRPDRVRLSDASTALTDRIEAAGREVSAAQGRRAELEARTSPAKSPVTALAA